MHEYTGRLNDPRMEYFKHVYRHSEHWHPEKGPLDGKTVIVYGEQGFGDIIQFARYIPLLLERKCKVVFHCPEALHRLFACLNVELLDKNNPVLPSHDYHILSMSLPFVLQQKNTTKHPYLKVDDVADLGPEPKKIGICWESGPTFTERDCPLRHFRVLGQNAKLIMLQKEIRRASLLDDCDDMDFFGYELKDFYDTAKVINAVDVVVTVDTSVLHLAGALGKSTYGLLNFEHDARWDVEPWYPSVTLVKLRNQDDWLAAFRTIIGLGKI